jgi:hypothetical protein
MNHIITAIKHPTSLYYLQLLWPANYRFLRQKRKKLYNATIKSYAIVSDKFYSIIFSLYFYGLQRKKKSLTSWVISKDNYATFC